MIESVYAAQGTSGVADPNPEGVWAATINMPDGMQEHALLLFLCGNSQDGEKAGGYIETSTQFPQPGLGGWKETGPSIFEANFIKQLRDEQGAYLGSLHVHLLGRLLSSTHFVGQGEGQMCDAEGHLIGTPLKNAIDAVRIPSPDSHWPV